MVCGEHQVILDFTASLDQWVQQAAWEEEAGLEEEAAEEQGFDRFSKAFDKEYFSSPCFRGADAVKATRGKPGFPGPPGPMGG